MTSVAIELDMMGRAVCDYHHLEIRRIRSDFAFASSHLSVDAQSTVPLTLYHQYFNHTGCKDVRVITGR
jgi:hypothetical protein